MKNLSIADLRVLIDELNKLIEIAEDNARFARKKTDPKVRESYLLRAASYRKSLELVKTEMAERIHAIHHEIKFQ